MASPIRVFAITELRRTGAGQLSPTMRQFRWDAPSHTAPREALEAELLVKTVRREQPGTSEVVEQVLSATWQPFDLEGEWDDKHAGPGYAMSTYRDFARLVQSAPLVRLEIEQIALVGLITNLRLRYERRTKVGWSFTFSPHVHETVASARTIGRLIQQPTSKPMREHVAAAKEIALELDSGNRAARTLPTSDATFLDGAVQISTMLAAVTRVETAASAGLETEAGQKLLNLAGQFKTIGQASLAVAANLRSARSGASAGFDSPILWLRFDEAAHTQQARAALLTARALEAEADMIARADAKPRAVHRPHAGESLYAISRRYYGTPDEWRSIYNANKLDSIVLEGTEELVIPARAA